LWLVDQGSATEGRLVANTVIIARFPFNGLTDNDNQPDRPGASGMRKLTAYNLRNLQIDGGQTLMLTSNADPTLNIQFKRQLTIEELPG